MRLYAHSPPERCHKTLKPSAYPPLLTHNEWAEGGFPLTKFGHLISLAPYLYASLGDRLMTHPTPRKRSILWAAVLLPSLCLGLIFAWAGGVIGGDTLTPSHFMALFHKAGAPTTGFRRAHAKGLCVTGWFEPSEAGRTLSKSSIFRGTHLPVIGRFSLAPPMPYLADNPAIARSLAFQIRSQTGDDWRLALVDVPLQPIRDLHDALAFFGSNALDPITHQPDPARAKAYADARPWLRTAFSQNAQRAVSSGLEDDSYNSLDSFYLTNHTGKKTAVRWTATPLEPFHPAGSPSEDDKNYLFKQLIRTLNQHPLSWSLTATIARAGDPINDPSQPWSPTAEKLSVGTLTFTKAYSEDEKGCGPMVFDPTILPSGITVTDDPLLALRSSIYMHSYSTRAGEAKTPSMVTSHIIASPTLSTHEKGQ